MLVEFANHFHASSQMSSCDLKLIITTSEVLTVLQHRLLEGVFWMRVFGEYDCGELG